MYKKIIFLMAASIILVPSIHAFSLRLNVPVAGSYEVDDCSGCSPKSGGYSIRGIFGMFGLGYTVGTFDWGYPSTSDNTDQKLAANAVDLSASFSFFTVGVGSVISGTVEGKYGYTETKTDVPATGYTRTLTSVVDAKRELDGSMTGTTSFINFNFGIGPIDLLVGYRMWNIKAKHKLVGTQKITQTVTPDIGLNSITTTSVNQSGSEEKMDFNQITAGIGFAF
jgi:hypothetical protein